MIVAPSKEVIELINYYSKCSMYAEMRGIAAFIARKNADKIFNTFHSYKFMDGEDWVIGRVQINNEAYIFFKGTNEQLAENLRNIKINRKKISDRQAVAGFEQILIRLFNTERMTKIGQRINHRNITTVDGLRSVLPNYGYGWRFLSRLELTDEHLQKAQNKLAMIDVVEK